MMIKRFLWLTPLIVLSLIVLAACAAPTPSPTVTPPTATPTAVPATPPPPATPESASLGLQPADIQLDGQGVVQSWQAVLVPGAPFDNMHAPGPSGVPAHIQVLFDGVSDPYARESGAPVLYIIPVDAYRQLWESHDSRIVSDQIRKIARFSQKLPQPAPTRGLPVLPMEETYGINDFATQLRPANPTEASASKNGFRFIGRFGLDANPVTNQGLRYIYQGFSNDGRYLITFFFPVRTGQLPDGVDAAPQADVDALKANGLGYLDKKSAQLDALTPSDWEPDLSKLDALVASLQIADMPGTGLIPGDWQWVNWRPAGADAPSPVDDPASYTLKFDEEGRLQLQADCNQVSATYQATGGMAGALTLSLGPSTRAACGPDSLGDAFLQNLTQVRRFSIAPGGHTLQLAQKDGAQMTFSDVSQPF